MRALALLAWLLALLLAALIMSQLQREPPRVARTAASQVPELLLWRQPVVAQMPSAVRGMASTVPVTDVPSAPEKARACARLGVFPTGAWAGEVLSRLSDAADDDNRLAAWKVTRVGDDGFYIVFAGLPQEVLAARLDAVRQHSVHCCRDRCSQNLASE